MNLPTLDALYAEQCRRSFYQFFLHFWETIEAGDLVPNWHLKELCDEAQAYVERIIAGEPALHDLVINVPPGTSKSSVFTKILPAWCWVRMASMRIISASYAADVSLALSVKSRDLMRSDKFLRFYGHLFKFKADSDAKSHYENDKTGARYSTSVGGAITSKHAHLIIIDDPINPKMAASEALRKEANEWMDKTLSTRKVDKKVTGTILVMQRLHEMDPTGHWLKKPGKKVRHICLPGEAGPQVSPPELAAKYIDGLLDPVRLDRDALALLKVDLGSYGYANQIEQRPAPDEGGMIKKAWFGKISYGEFLQVVAAAKVTPRWDFDADTAYTKDQTNDPSALMASCYIKPNLYVRAVKSVWLEFPDLVKEIKSFAAREGYTSASKVYIEPKASGKSTVQTLRRESELNVIEAPVPDTDKVTRVNAVAPFIEAGRVVLIEGEWNESFVQQCASFPNASHDDEVDVLVQAINRNNKKSGMSWA